MGCNVDVCLATYNGAKYLSEFYNSLLNQSYKEWTLIVRDDQSKDATPIIIDEFAKKSNNVHVVDKFSGNFGVMKNFSVLLSESTSNYVLLADQDDIWEPNKIADCLKEIISLERNSLGEIIPALVFSDLKVVDGDLNLIHPSFLEMQGLSKLQHPSFSQLLTQNVAPGCAMIMNRALLEVALPIPSNAAMHDWWLIQVASLFGRIGFVNKPLVQYRQHGKNVVGAHSFDLLLILKDIIFGASNYKNRLRKAQIQAMTLNSRYSHLMGTSAIASATAFANLLELPPVLRQISAIKNGLKKSGFIRTVGFYFLM
jgi:glycosyltransferase involved in cell wall biosynthesis